MRQRSATSTTLIKTVIDNRGGHRKSRLINQRTPRQRPGAATITVRVPLSTQQRGTRKLVLTPSGEPHWTSQGVRIDDILIKAIARAHRWNRMLDRGEYASMTDLAKAEDVTESYLARILRLTLLSPRIIEAVLDGQPNDAPQLQQLIKHFPMAWNEQESVFDTH